MIGVGLDVRTALSAANANKPGFLERRVCAWRIYQDDQLSKAKSIRSLIVSYRNGAPVSLPRRGRSQ